MKLKDVLSKIIKNKASGQSVISIKQRELKKLGISEKELLNMKIDDYLNLKGCLK
jgi:hypothetical protein